jgi:hypothetical protein
LFTRPIQTASVRKYDIFERSVTNANSYTNKFDFNVIELRTTLPLLPGRHTRSSVSMMATAKAARATMSGSSALCQRYFVARFAPFYNFLGWSPTWETTDIWSAGETNQIMQYVYDIDPWKRPLTSMTARTANIKEGYHSRCDNKRVGTY